MHKFCACLNGTLFDFQGVSWVFSGLSRVFRRCISRVNNICSSGVIGVSVKSVFRVFKNVFQWHEKGLYTFFIFAHGNGNLKSDTYYNPMILT